MKNVLVVLYLLLLSQIYNQVVLKGRLIYLNSNSFSVKNIQTSATGANPVITDNFGSILIQKYI